MCVVTAAQELYCAQLQATRSTKEVLGHHRRMVQILAWFSHTQRPQSERCEIPQGTAHCSSQQSAHARKHVQMESCSMKSKCHFLRLRCLFLEFKTIGFAQHGHFGGCNVLTWRAHISRAARRRRMPQDLVINFSVRAASR